MKDIFYTIGSVTLYRENNRFEELDARDIRLKYKDDYTKFLSDILKV